jgi:hypothetical protein
VLSTIIREWIKHTIRLLKARDWEAGRNLQGTVPRLPGGEAWVQAQALAGQSLGPSTQVPVPPGHPRAVASTQAGEGCSSMSLGRHGEPALGQPRSRRTGAGAHWELGALQGWGLLGSLGGLFLRPQGL